MSKPNWHEYFLGLAAVISLRSNDAQTKHGSIIVNSENKIIGTGYNGPIKGIDDSKVPNFRPDKYPYIIHAELNAILNSSSLATGATIYITGRPCNPCLKHIIQAGIKKIIFDRNRNYNGWDEKETLELFNFFVNQSGVEVFPTTCDNNWIKEGLFLK